MPEIVHLIAQRVLQPVQSTSQTGAVDCAAECARQRIGDPVDLVDRVVHEIERLDARQLEFEILREINVRLAGSELLQAAGDIDDGQLDRGIFER